jgi:CIC family chloride channel protein
MFNVIGRMTRKKTPLALVVKTHRRVPHVSDVIGVIAKEHIADSVGESVRPYVASDLTI